MLQVVARVALPIQAYRPGSRQLEPRADRVGLPTSLQDARHSARRVGGTACARQPVYVGMAGGSSALLA
ncbi:hypothetical protein A7D01_01420 [Xanthomonas arboricola]|nr:hypothetical protein A7D01_01420 [Xanthomonas arboricola]